MNRGLIVGGLHWKAALLMTAALLALPAQAQVYKCTEGGKTVFRDVPCFAKDVPVIEKKPERETFLADADDAKGDETARLLSSIRSLTLSPSSVNTSASARRDGMEVKLNFNDAQNKSVDIEDVAGLSVSAAVFQYKDDKKGSTLGRYSGATIQGFRHYFIVPISTSLQTPVLVEARVTLPDGRRLDAATSHTFFPNP